MQRDSEDRDAAENEETHARPSPRGPLPETHTYAHAHAQISPVNPASLRAHGPILILVLVALAAVLVRHVRTIQLLAFVPIDPAQAREVERERLVELGLAYRVKRLAARSLARPPVTGTGTEQRRRKTQTHLQHLDLHARGRRRVYPAFPLVVLLSATKSTNQ